MKINTTLLFAALALSAAPLSQAGDRQAFGNGELPEALKAFDLDNDGKLNVEERKAFEQAVRDGLVVRPVRPPHNGDGTPPVRPPNPFDTNGDGKLSPEELAAAQIIIAERIKAERTKRFAELDKDSNGELTAAELALIPRIKPEMVAALIRRLDKDANKTISLTEFLASFGPGPRPPVRPPVGDPPVGPVGPPVEPRR